MAVFGKKKRSFLASLSRSRKDKPGSEKSSKQLRKELKKEAKRQMKQAREQPSKCRDV